MADSDRSRVYGSGLVPALASFALLGLTAGVWQVVLPDLQRALGLSAGVLGSALSLGWVASFPAMLIVGRLADRWGARTPIAGIALLMMLAMLGMTLVDRYWLLVLLLLLFYGGMGGFDVSINTLGIRVERVTGRRLMPYLHATYSGSAALGSALAGLLSLLGVPFRALYLGLAVAMAGLAWAVLRGRAVPAPADPPSAAADPPQAGWALVRAPALLLLALIAALSFFTEGTLETWSAIYLRSALGLSAALGAAGPAVFHSAMLAGRLGIGRIAGRLDRRRILQAAGVLAAGGVAIALATTIPAVILAGFLLAGLALAGVAPIAFSLAGDCAPEHAGQASSIITTVGYAGFPFGPALIGGLTELAGLRVAFTSLVLAGGLIVGLSSRIAKTVRT